MAITDNHVEQLALDKYPVLILFGRDKKCTAHMQKTRDLTAIYSPFILLCSANSLSNKLLKYLCWGGSYCINTEAINKRRKMFTIQNQIDIWKLMIQSLSVCELTGLCVSFFLCEALIVKDSMHVQYCMYLSALDPH